MKFKIIPILFGLCAYIEATLPKKDCSLNSLHAMNFVDLLSKSSENELCRTEARKVMGSKYSYIQVVVNGPFTDDKEKVIQEKERSSKRAIVIRNMAAIKEVWSKFGDMIKNLIVNFIDIDLDQGIELVKFINSEASKYLTSVQFGNCISNVLDELTNEFINVISFSFSRSETADFEFKYDQRMGNIFPSVKTLRISETKISDWVFFGGESPGLEALGLIRPNGAEEQIIQFVKKNQQIIDLKIYESNLEFLNQLKENMPNLKLLKLYEISGMYNAVPIHFDTVLVLRINSKIIPENLFFENLETLILDLSAYELTDKWIQFIDTKISKDLDVFRLIVEKLSREHFQSFPDKMPNLSTAIIQCQTPFSVADIAQFLDKADHLDELDLRFQQEQLEMNVPVEAAKRARKNGKIWSIRKPTSLEAMTDHSCYQFFSTKKVVPNGVNSVIGAENSEGNMENQLLNSDSKLEAKSAPGTPKLASRQFKPYKSNPVYGSPNKLILKNRNGYGYGHGHKQKRGDLSTKLKNYELHEIAPNQGNDLNNLLYPAEENDAVKPIAPEDTTEQFALDPQNMQIPQASVIPTQAKEPSKPIFFTAGNNPNVQAQETGLFSQNAHNSGKLFPQSNLLNQQNNPNSQIPANPGHIVFNSNALSETDDDESSEQGSPRTENVDNFNSNHPSLGKGLSDSAPENEESNSKNPSAAKPQSANAKPVKNQANGPKDEKDSKPTNNDNSEANGENNDGNNNDGTSIEHSAINLITSLIIIFAFVDSF